MLKLSHLVSREACITVDLIPEPLFKHSGILPPGPKLYRQLVGKLGFQF